MNRVSTTLLAVVAVGWFAGRPPAQVLPNQLRVEYVAVANADRVSVALALPVGWRHDPVGRTGCAEVVRWTLDLAQRDASPGTRFAVEVRQSHTLLWHTGPARLVADRLDFLRRLLAGELVISADLHALALGRARLAADDSSWLKPGRVIQQKAWRTLLQGRAGGRRHLGLPAEIAAIDHAELIERYRRACGPVGASLVVIGDLDAAVWPAAVAGFGAIASRGDRLTPTVHDAAPPVVASTSHDRVDGPYVTAAVAAPAPGHAEFPAFVLGIAVLQSQAQGSFTQRGMEWRADFPAVAYDYWKGAAVVLVNRRGPNASAASVPRREIEDLLAALRTRGVRQGQLDGARREVTRILAVPPFGDLPAPVLAVRARYRAMATCLGWPEDLAGRVAGIGVDQVNRALRAHLDPKRVRWFELTPTDATVQRLTRQFRTSRSGGERRVVPRFP